MVMKRAKWFLPLFFLLTMCAAPSLTTASPPEFKLKGQIKDENGKPISSASIFFETYWKINNRSTNTDHQGEFFISIQENGTLHIDVNQSQRIEEDIIYRIDFIKDKGVVEIDGKIYKRDDILFVEVRYDAQGRILGNRMKRAFEFIVACDARGASDCVVSEGKDYIQKYRGVAGSRWEEVAKLVKEAEVIKAEKEFLAIKNLNIKEDYEAVISQGKDYIEKYRDIAGSHWKEMATLLKKAEQRKKQVEEETRKAEAAEKKREEKRKKAEYKKFGLTGKLEKDLPKVAHLWRSVNQKRLQWRYTIKHNTTSDKIESETERFYEWHSENMEPLARLFESLIYEYMEHYSRQKLRDFAIKNNFLDTLDVIFKGGF